MNKTDIEYLDKTWNPWAMRCTRTESPGCVNCWHQTFAKRHAGNPIFTNEERAAWAGKGPPVLRLDELEAPSKLKKPSRIGVQFMGDLFHEKVSESQWISILDSMKSAPQHTYLILTKRPYTMKLVLESFGGPLKNWWLGVSVSNQDDADRWIPALLEIPAAKRFVSYEPALGPVDFKPYLRCPDCGYSKADQNIHLDHHLCKGRGWLDLLIAGGESGPGARPSHPDWFRRVRDDCDAAGIPFNFKQWGKWCPVLQIPGDFKPITSKDALSRTHIWYDENGVRGDVSFKVGKKAAGRELDGRIHDGWPENP